MDCLQHRHCVAHPYQMTWPFLFPLVVKRKQNKAIKSSWRFEQNQHHNISKLSQECSCLEETHLIQIGLQSVPEWSRVLQNIRDPKCYSKFQTTLGIPSEKCLIALKGIRKHRGTNSALLAFPKSLWFRLVFTVPSCCVLFWSHDRMTGLIFGKIVPRGSSNSLFKFVESCKIN